MFKVDMSSADRVFSPFAPSCQTIALKWIISIMILYFFRCEATANTESFVTTRWPYRFVSLTRADTPLREPLESCAVSVFPGGT